MSKSATAERLARQMGASFVRRPTSAETSEETTEGIAWATSFVDVVETAVRGARAAAVSATTDRSRSGTMQAVPSVLLAAPGTNARAVIPSFVKNQLGLRCESVAGAAEAFLRLGNGYEGPRIQAVIIDPAVLIDPLGGDDLSALLRRTAMPVVVLRLGDDDDPTVVGRAAWDAVPALRAAVGNARARSA